MRHRHPGQLFVAPQGATPKAPVAGPACVTATDYGIPHHTVRVPIGSPTEGPTGCVRMRHRHPGQRFVGP
eukprot:1169522-Pyramimonas_sp.AAC.1